MGNTPTQQWVATTHTLFGQPFDLVVNNGEKTHVVTFPVSDEEEGKRFINRFNITESFAKKHLFLSANRTMENTFMCGNAKSFKCTFPFYPYSLEQELQKRSQNKLFLVKEQLTYLVYQLVDGARNFDRIDEKVGDIRPAQILLDESKRRVKLVNFFTAPNLDSGLQKALQLKERTYLAPQQLRSLQKGNPNPDINVHKADGFSLGLTMLAIGNLKKMQDQLYNWGQFSFSWTQLSNQIETFQNRYGHFLAEIVKGLLQNQPRNRLYIGEVAALLQFYEKHILEMLDFQPDFALLEKSYELNYSGPRSEGFVRWLQVCREFYVPKTIVQHRPMVAVTPVVQVKKPMVQLIKKVTVNPPMIIKPPVIINPSVVKTSSSIVTQTNKLVNSRVNFYYQSPAVVKRGI